MLNQEKVFEKLISSGVEFFAGVPDSYLNGFCNYALKNYEEKNVMAANEGNAVGIAAGYYFANKKLPLVYMQNSGLGNIVNPIASLVDENVYSVPMLLLVGWRGEPGTGDWPQHHLQGEITTKLLDTLNIPYSILKDDIEDFSAVIDKAVSYANESRKPYALIAPKGVMAGEKSNDENNTYPMSREEAIEATLDAMPADTIYSATTGRATRELFFLRERRGESKANDFLNVGSMGHASSVALGIAMSKPERKVVVLDGDAAVIMHMGALTMVSKTDVPNLLHIVLNNGANESVGGQPSAGYKIDFTKIAEACGYNTVGWAVSTKEELVDAIKKLSSENKPGFIEVRIHKGLRAPLPPLDFSHRKAIDELIDNLNK